MSLFLSLFIQLVIGIHIQQLCRSKISKNGKSVGLLDTKDQKKEEGSIWLNFQDTTNVKLFSYLNEIFHAL